MKKKIVPIIIVIVAVAAAFFVYTNFFQNDDETAPVDKTTMETLEETYYYVPGDYFVTNITGSQVLCKTSIALALTGDDQTKFLEDNNAVIRNAIIKVLISHDEEQMRSPQAIDVLESEMASEVTNALGIEGLERVIISDFVIQ